TRQDRAEDYAGRIVAVTGLSLPDFWLGTLVITFAAIWFHWIPPLGYASLWDAPLKNLQQFLLPAAVLGYRLSAATMRMTRSTVLEVLREYYVRTAWAKGLAGRIVVYKHALKNALIPVVTIVGGQLGTLLAGTVIVETIFALPGMGRLTVEAIVFRDYPVVQTNVMLVATVLVALNLVVDLTYAWLDPRIHYKNGSKAPCQGACLGVSRCLRTQCHPPRRMLPWSPHSRSCSTAASRPCGASRSASRSERPPPLSSCSWCSQRYSQ